MLEIQERGYAVIAHLFTHDECDELLRQLGAPEVTRSRAGARHLLSNSAVSALANDARLSALAAAVVGSEAIPFRATLFDKSVDSNWAVVWHQDTALPLRYHFDAPGWGPWSVKAGVHYAHAPSEALEQVVAIRVQLDDSSGHNGPLRVLPGTHRLGVLSDDEVAQMARTSNAAECLVPRGGVLMMRPLLIHSSSKSLSASRRRVLHIEYAADSILGDGVELAVA